MSGCWDVSCVYQDLQPEGGRNVGNGGMGAEGCCRVFFTEFQIITLPETNIFAPENGWLEDDCFLLGWPIFRCYIYVSFRECKFQTFRDFTLADSLVVNVGGFNYSTCRILDRCMYRVFPLRIQPLVIGDSQDSTSRAT